MQQQQIFRYPVIINHLDTGVEFVASSIPRMSKQSFGLQSSGKIDSGVVAEQSQISWYFFEDMRIESLGMSMSR